MASFKSFQSTHSLLATGFAINSGSGPDFQRYGITVSSGWQIIDCRIASRQCTTFVSDKVSKDWHHWTYNCVLESLPQVHSLAIQGSSDPCRMSAESSARQISICVSVWRMGWEAFTKQWRLWWTVSTTARLSSFRRALSFNSSCFASSRRSRNPWTCPGVAVTVSSAILPIFPLCQRCEKTYGTSACSMLAPLRCSVAP